MINFKCYLSILVLFIFINVNSTAQELSMFQSIFTFEYYEDNNRISTEEFKSLIKSNPDSKAYWYKSRRHVAYSYVGLATN